MGESEIFCSEDLKVRDYSTDLGVGGKISHCILEKWMCIYGLDSSGSGQGPVAGSYGHSNERLGSIKYGESF